MLQSYLSPSSRQKIYLILVFSSLILLFYSVWQVKPVIVEADDTFGLVSRLTPCYWIGLALLLAASILAFLDRELNKDAIFLTILIALGLFLIVLPAFIYENPTENTNYYPFSEINNWLPAHHLDIGTPPHLASYYSWPAFQFISALIVEILGDSFEFFEFAKYIPIFFMLCFIFTTYAIGKRLELAPNRCFLLSFLALSSWLLITVDYAPRTLGMMLFLLLFMLLLTPRRTVAESIMAILLFSAIVITHPLTTLAVLPALILLSIYRREPRFVALFVVIFGAWYMYQASLALEVGIQQALTYPMSQIVTLAQQETPLPQQVSMARIVTRDSWMIYGILYFALMIGSIILLLGRRIAGERRKQVISAFCWAIGVALVMLFVGFGDELQRIYIFCLVPAAGIIVLSFPTQKVVTALMIVLMSIFVALHMPADYSGAVAWGQLTTTEVRGSEFFALKVKPEESYYYDGNGVLIQYYDPNLVTVPPKITSLGKLPDEVALSRLDESRYVVISKKATDIWLFSWGKDPIAAWPQTEVGKKADLIYNNGYFQIYENHLAE